VKNRQNTINRRGFLAGLAGCGSVARLGLGGGFGLATMGAAAQAPISSNGTHLVLLGTQGGPNFNAERTECSNVVVVDGRPYLVDCGYGALGRLKESGLGFRDIGNVFLTHLHDDHTSDLAALLSHQWTDGRLDPNLIIGPYGTERLVEAALAFSSANAAIRLTDEARSVKPADIFSGRDIQATTAPTEVFADDRVTVTSVENTHFPESTKQAVPYRSVSYRFDTRNRSITISGDTAYSENLVRLAEGSDVFLCETIQVELTRQNFDSRVAAGAYADNPEGIWKHIVGTHSSTEIAGRMAAEAGVGMLVLTHLVPGAQMDVPDEVYLEGVRKRFDGEVIVGKDLMVI
jgi:ribonuclease BN (tRNA processing enzyme)